MASRVDLLNPHGDPAGDDASHRPVSILLDEQRPRFTDCHNETTATAKSRAGYTISVSFWMADPPNLSFFSVHCTKPPGSKSRTVDFKLLPHVVGAEGRFVLLRCRFFSRYGRDEYFMYRAGDGDGQSPPSLEWIPLPDPDDDTGTRMLKDFGIVPRDDDHGGHHYLLAALSEDHDDPSEYHLQLYSSKNKSWSTRTLLDPIPGVERITPEKVIRLEEGILGWVDFSQGLLVLDLRQDPPSVVRFIPLPKPLPESRDRLKLPSTGDKSKLPSTGASTRSFRDITCVNGLLKFIEMVHFQVPEEASTTSGDEDVLYDSDLMRSLKRKRMDGEPKPRHGWRAVTWSRMVSSDCWRKGYVVDVADVSVDASAHSLLSGLRDDNFGKLTFRDLYSAFPTLSTCLDDTLYLKTMVEPSDDSGWVVAVDLGNKTVKALGAYSFEKCDPFKQPFRPCALPCYLNMTPGIEVSAFREIRELVSYPDCPDETSICMDEDLLSQPKFEILRQLQESIKQARNGRQSVVQKDHISQVHTIQSNMLESSKLQRPLDEKINPLQNEAQSIVRNDHVSQVGPVQNSFVESTGKLQRPMGEETNCSRTEDQCVVQSDNVPLVHPQNNLQFKWDRPMYPGQPWRMYRPEQPSWHHQHMPFQRPQQSLESTVPSDPGYAPLAPAPSLYGYVNNHQPVWQQPLPTKRSTWFGSQHEVPQKIKWNGASYHGFS